MGTKYARAFFFFFFFFRNFSAVLKCEKNADSEEKLSEEKLTNRWLLLCTFTNISVLLCNISFCVLALHLPFALLSVHLSFPLSFLSDCSPVTLACASTHAHARTHVYFCLCEDFQTRSSATKCQKPKLNPDLNLSQ